jgi:RNA polymerase sigma factor (sigma-70 family)
MRIIVHMHELNDEDIIKLVLQGKQNAYAILVERYQHLVYTLALRLLANNEDAEEAAQDAFIKAYQALHTYNATSKFSTWLYTITRNTCISRVRTNRQHLVNKDNEQLANIAGHTDSTMLQQETNARKTMLNKAIAMLPIDESQVITLFYIHEQSLEEIGHILDITNSNAKVRLYRARKKLKEILDNHFSNEFTEYHKSS